jgi:very-short-patch-repair endonuclease
VGTSKSAERILTPREAAAQKRIAELRKRLLDLSNSNRLLNYKFSSRSRRLARVVDELPDQLVKKLENGKRLVFKSLPEPRDEPEDEKSDAFLLALEQAKRSDDEYLAALKAIAEDEEGESARRIERALRDRLRKKLGMPDRRVGDQISKAEWARQNGIEPSFDLPLPAKTKMPSHLDGDMQTLLLPEEMERALSTINDHARSALQETGVNTLYLALGFLEWFEAPDSQTPMYAPLLLYPIDIDRRSVSGRYRYSIGSLDEEIEINITLSERLHQDFHRRLPQLDEDETPEDYFRKVTATIEGISGWRVRRFAVVGHFAFARLVMFQDLEETRWPEGVGIIANPVVAEIFAGNGDASDAFFAEDYAVDEPTIAGKVPLLITDADSSQFSAIADVMDGRNLAIKGPPGTGKSQTITNIIAAALANNKTILFVAEKMAALNVVKDRLEKAGLGHFCLELHSTKARKKDLLDSLQSRLSVQNRLRADGGLAGAIREFERTRDQLSDYVATINRVFGASGKTVHQILWSEQRTRAQGGALPKTLDDIELADAEKLTRHDVAVLKDKLDVVAGAYSDVTTQGCLDQHPWFGVGDPTLGYFGRERLLEDMKAFREASRRFARGIEEFGQRVEASISDKFGEARSLIESLSGVPKPEIELDLDLYTKLYDPADLASLDAFQTVQSAWLEAGRQLSELASDPLDLVHQIAELNAVASLVKDAGVDDKRLQALSAEAAVVSADADRVGRTVEVGRQLAEAFGIETPITVGTVRRLLAAAKHSASLSHDLRALRHPRLFDEAAYRLLAEARERAEILRQKLTPLTERLDFELDGEASECRRHAEVLRTARFPSLLWRSDVRASKARYKKLLRTPRKSKRLEVSSDFEALAQCLEQGEALTSNTDLAAVCGTHFCGHQTPFDKLVTVNAYAISVKETFGAADSTDSRISHVLLEGSSEVLAKIALFCKHPDVEIAEETAQSIFDLKSDLATLRDTLKVRAEKIADLSFRALALGLNPALEVGLIAGVVDVVTARIAAEEKIEANIQARELLGSRWRGPATDRPLIMNALHAASEVERANLPKPIRRYLYHADRNGRVTELRALHEPLKETVNLAWFTWGKVNILGKFDESAFFGSSFDSTSASFAVERINRALDAPDQLAVWTNWLVARQDCVDNGLSSLIEAFADQHLDAVRLSAALDRVFWRTLARAAFGEYPVLGKFNGLQLEKARERFRRLDEEIIELQRKELAADLCRRGIDPGYKGITVKEHTGLELVHHEHHKQKRHIPIRELLDRAGRSIQQMKPCFMMSPLSVAQFLKPNRARFDLVLIDEASQMRPEEALGAVARGGQLVVVGDPMQLPPTSFFDRADRMADDDIDQDEIIDNESILDLALAEFRPARSLRWHYRSRHESLIAFSNREFYDDLIVFPSPLDPDRDKRDPKMGVYNHIVSGKYKGRINIEEAQKVAEAAITFMATEPDKSLGIVTLNQTQRDVLLEEMERLLSREPLAEQFVERWENTLEPFFIKNLENVQGDERDVIFISTVYGPDAATGIVKNQFGPINGKYGHRRLNVLFSRAKHRVEVFTSMRPADIRPDEKSQRGVRVLKAYLEYAETGRLDAGFASGREPDSEFEELVRDRLQEKGYEVVPQVGVAGYFIDLAVKHPKRSGFVLGIECDGASYHSSRSARDRDRIRQQVLERLKWNIYRIWSTDWFQNPGEQLRRLLGHLDGLLSEEV